MPVTIAIELEIRDKIVSNFLIPTVDFTCDQGAGKRPRQCCHPKGPRTKGTATRGPEGPESGQNMRVRGPEGPEDELEAECPFWRLPVLLYVFHDSAKNRDFHGTI